MKRANVISKGFNDNKGDQRSKVDPAKKKMNEDNTKGIMFWVWGKRAYSI